MQTKMTFEGYELMCRMIERYTGKKRPEGMTAKQAIQTMTTEETRQVFGELADAAISYVKELAVSLDRAGQTMH